MKIINWKSGFVREPLARPFGFKGGYISELWLPAVRLTDAAGHEGLGTSVQSVLWSDANVFARFRENGGNAMMYALTCYALESAVGLEWSTPIELQEVLLPRLTDYARQVCADPHLRLTFVLNALVLVDNAAWQLYAHSHGIDDFDALIPLEYRLALSVRQPRLAAVPLVSYVLPLEQAAAEAASGCPMLKIKIGANPDGDGDPEKMLQWDCRRLTELHRVLKDFRTADTVTGHVAYYLDANGRYDSKERLLRFLDHAAKIGALERIALLEEPFTEEAEFEVGDLPVCVAADESAHSYADAQRRIDQGYRAMALKPVAKTLSMSLKVLRVAHRAGISCFCADLTVPPYLLEWNRNIAARLAPLPSMRCGVLESNGAQNYINWSSMLAAHPCPNSNWLVPQQGKFVLDDGFYRCSGGVLQMPEYYQQLCGR